MAAPRVMVVDDDRANLNVFTELLSRHGYDVCPVSGPREALEIVRSQPPFDLVLSDVIMPEMQGTDLAREIAHLAPETAFILMTASVFDASRIPPGVMLLRKPFRERDLITAIERAIAGSAEMRAKLRQPIEQRAETQGESTQQSAEAGTKSASTANDQIIS